MGGQYGKVGCEEIMHTAEERLKILKKDPQTQFPMHVAIIPDGNGRWAEKKGKFVTFGHKEGSKVAQNIIEFLSTAPQIRIVTLWGFSTDNWKRTGKEVKGLMALFETVIHQMLSNLQKRNGRFIHIGRKDRISEKLRKTIAFAEKSTEKNTGSILCLAIDFGGVDQDIRVIEKALALSLKKVDVATLWSLRDGGGLVPAADLLIRSSGEQRISDIGWINGAQTELYFEKKLFPDMTTHDVVDALIAFSKRERRMGGRIK